MALEVTTMGTISDRVVPAQKQCPWALIMTIKCPNSAHAVPTGTSGHWILPFVLYFRNNSITFYEMCYVKILLTPPTMIQIWNPIPKLVGDAKSMDINCFLVLYYSFLVQYYFFPALDTELFVHVKSLKRHNSAKLYVIYKIRHMSEWSRDRKRHFSNDSFP